MQAQAQVRVEARVRVQVEARVQVRVRVQVEALARAAWKDRCGVRECLNQLEIPQNERHDA